MCLVGWSNTILRTVVQDLYMLTLLLIICPQLIQWSWSRCLSWELSLYKDDELLLEAVMRKALESQRPDVGVNSRVSSIYANGIESRHIDTWHYTWLADKSKTKNDRNMQSHPKPQEKQRCLRVLNAINDQEDALDCISPGLGSQFFSSKVRFWLGSWIVGFFCVCIMTQVKTTATNDQPTNNFKYW